MSSLYRCHCDANPSSRWQNDGMPAHIALLGGINVGGCNRVAMGDLREVVLGLGHTEVATYIQSGKWSSPARKPTPRGSPQRSSAPSPSTWAAPTVAVLTRAELAQVVADNPFPDEPNPRWVHAIFGNGPWARRACRRGSRPAAARDEGSDDEAWVVGTTLFLHTPVASAAASWPPS
jgi:uncharacterized protein (DUF1697 family)